MDTLEKSLAKSISLSVIEEVCPEELPFFHLAINSENQKVRFPNGLAFGSDGAEIAITAIVVETVKSALAEIWDIIKPALKESATDGAKQIRAKMFVSLKENEPSKAVTLTESDLDRVQAAAHRSALKNGCSADQAQKISQSVKRSIRYSLIK